jgi:hypothetical protein
MSKKIEIFENTLLKLLVRRGANVDRQNIILSEGELGYTTDTKRLYVGDGQTLGGNLVGGSKFLGSNPLVTTFTNAITGDIAFDSDNNVLYTFLGGDPTDTTRWSPIGGVYSPGNGTLSATFSNGLVVNQLSAGNVSLNLLGRDIALESGKIALSSSISVDKIQPLTTNKLNLTQNLTINNVDYRWPASGGANNTFLTTDSAGNLRWDVYSAGSTLFVSGTAGQVPVGSIMPFVSAGGNEPTGWLLCNGQPALSTVYPDLYSVIGTSFGTGSTNEFRVPNLINKTLYGVNGAPATTTTFNVASGSNSVLSAAGALYIIKAKPDNIVSSQFTITSPVCATVNGTGASVLSPLSGNVQLGLQSVFAGSTLVRGTFTADQYGRVTSVTNEKTGTLSAVAPGSQNAYNVNSSGMVFFQTPFSIIPSTNNFTGQTFTISAYPYLTDYAGTVSTYSVPPSAKNLIVDSWISKSGPDGGSIVRIIAGAPNISLLTTIGTQYIGSTEFWINASAAAGKGDYIANSTQTILPLSTNNGGNLVCAFRVNTSSGDNLALRVVGYTY